MIYTKTGETEILKWLKNNLNEERYLHSIGTAECARILAETFHLDKEKAYIAGLLHDSAKCFPKDKLLNIIESYLDISEAEKENFKTLHAPVSAYVAKNTFGVTDSEILSAIRWHTLGKVDMSTFEKIIFIADKIEPNTRDKQYYTYMMSIISEENGLNKALLVCYKHTITSLVERDLKICTDTIDIYNRLQDELKQ